MAELREDGSGALCRRVGKGQSQKRGSTRGRVRSPGIEKTAKSGRNGAGCASLRSLLQLGGGEVFANWRIWAGKGVRWLALFRHIPPFGGAARFSISSAVQRIRRWQVLGVRGVRWLAWRWGRGQKILKHPTTNIERRTSNGMNGDNGGRRIAPLMAARTAARRPYQQRLRICQPKQAKEKDLRGAGI